MEGRRNRGWRFPGLVQRRHRFRFHFRELQVTFEDVRCSPDRCFPEVVQVLGDVRAQARVQVRISRLELGLFGDARFFHGIGELRIDYGPGYRVYFVKRSRRVVILLCGGDKSSQSKDIKMATAMAKELD